MIIAPFLKPYIIPPPKNFIDKGLETDAAEKTAYILKQWLFAYIILNVQVIFIFKKFLLCFNVLG